MLLLAAEAVVLVVLGGAGIAALLARGSSRVAVAVALAVSAALVAWLLLGCARGLGSGRAWVRGPAATVQILALLVAFSFFQGGLVALPAAIAGVAAVTLAGLVTSSVARYTERDRHPFADDDDDPDSPVQPESREA